MICIQTINKYCKEDISLIENYDKAINDKEHIWDCHHKLEIGEGYTNSTEDLKLMNLYFNRPANELIFITHAEHSKLHHTGHVLSEDTKIKVSKAMKGNSNNKKKGKTTSTFGRKFKEHYGITQYDNKPLYHKEYSWYRNHNNKCRWEVL